MKERNLVAPSDRCDERPSIHDNNMKGTIMGKSSLQIGASLVLILFSLAVPRCESFRPPTETWSDVYPFSLGVRDSLMIAHSFHGHPSFGPAGGMHGATYTCDVDFLAQSLNEETNWVVDIGKASDVLGRVLSRYNLKNLDEVFPDHTMTTTEFMCKQIHDDICDLLREECEDFEGVVRVKLWESHKAWGTYTGPPNRRPNVTTAEEKS
jgi:6-pyruvoyltetrahydropterin/6-carboxytetrahydropterin synthase